MWRYREMMPVKYEENIISLGEGWTPLVRANRLGELKEFSNLYLKNESINPTGSFKARGMSAAISQAKEKGVKKIAIPTAGNAGGAAAAYAAKAGQEAYVFMPKDTPPLFFIRSMDERCVQSRNSRLGSIRHPARRGENHIAVEAELQQEH